MGEWPLPGGLMKQPARLVAATDLILSELRAVQEASSERKKKAQPSAPQTKRRRR
jgi:hypothetical protein